MPIPTFRCCICRREYPSYEEAQTCEVSHLAVVIAEAKRYMTGPYPYEIAVTFEDGVTKTFFMEGMQ